MSEKSMLTNYFLFLGLRAATSILCTVLRGQGGGLEFITSKTTSYMYWNEINMTSNLGQKKVVILMIFFILKSLCTTQLYWNAINMTTNRPKKSGSINKVVAVLGCFYRKMYGWPLWHFQ